MIWENSGMMLDKSKVIQKHPFYPLFERKKNLKTYVSGRMRHFATLFRKERRQSFQIIAYSRFKFRLIKNLTCDASGQSKWDFPGPVSVSAVVTLSRGNRRRKSRCLSNIRRTISIFHPRFWSGTFRKLGSRGVILLTEGPLPKITGSFHNQLVVLAEDWKNRQKKGMGTRVEKCEVKLLWK